MNKKLEAYKQSIKNKKVAVLGIGVSNTPLIKYLCALGTDITAFDRADEENLGATLEQLKDFKVKYSLGKDYLKNLKGFDMIFRTPGIRFDIPELVSEYERGAEITSEMEVFMDLCPAETFAVTGSDGKTTTTTLIYKMLVEGGYKCWLGGNIGMPLLSKIDEVKETDKVVLELSSFQLHTMKASPHVAVVTNLSPNHLDVHKSMEEYVDAKKNIFLYQHPRDKVILNYDNAITKDFEKDAKGRVVFFSRCNTLDKGAYLKENTLVFNDGSQETPIVEADDIILIGDHNVENYLTAFAAVSEHVSPEAMRRVATTFAGVEHRMEFVRTLGGVMFYNDSIGSSPTRTIAGLKAFKKKVVLIAGGYDKKIPYDEIGEIIVEKVKHLVLMGATGPKIEEALKQEIAKTGNGADVLISRCQSLEEAVQTAYKGAAEGDAIVLSPASASFDMFKNFEERGNRFKEIVNSL